MKKETSLTINSQVPWYFKGERAKKDSNLQAVLHPRNLQLPRMEKNYAAGWEHLLRKWCL